MEVKFFVDISVALYCYTVYIPLPTVNVIDEGFDGGAAFAVARWKFR
jgi:hypothetical protein